MSHARLRNILTLLASLAGVVVFGNGCTGFVGDVATLKPPIKPLSGVNTNSSSAVTGAPFVVQAGSHVVIMQYETWFGPQAQHFEGATAKPTLSSASMKSAGLIGYDSTDPLIIQQHAAWLSRMGVDAVEVDLSNAAACTFNSDLAQFCQNNPAWKTSLLAIRANLANLFGAYQSQRIALKILPLLDGQDADEFVVASDGTTAFEKQVRFFASLAQQYPNQWLLYQGKPLISIYSGVPSNSAYVAQANAILQATGLNQSFTVRFQSGFNDSQSNLWSSARAAAGLHQSAAQWAWVERLRPDLGLLPSYAVSGGTIENFTVTSAFPGATGWGNATTKVVASDAGLRGNGEIFRRNMAYAKTLAPTFLFIDQFNEYMFGDQGFNADTTNDLEPADLWGTAPMQMVTEEISAYRAVVGTGQTFIVGPGFFQISGDPAVYNSNGVDAFCGFGSNGDYLAAGGAANESNVLRGISSAPKSMRNDGACVVQQKIATATPVPTATSSPSTATPAVEPPGFFILPSGTVYNSNGVGHICGFANLATFFADGGANNGSNVRHENAYAAGTVYDGACAGPAMPQEFFRIGAGTPAIYYSNGTGAFCAYQSPTQFAAAGGHANQDNVVTIDGVVTGMRNDGACQ